MINLPSFWYFFLMICGTALYLAWREDVNHGPQYRGKEESWTPRYAFWLTYAAKMVFLAAICVFMQVVAWISEALV